MCNILRGMIKLADVTIIQTAITTRTTVLTHITEVVFVVIGQLGVSYNAHLFCVYVSMLALHFAQLKHY